MSDPITRLNAALKARYRIESQLVSKRGRCHILLSAALMLLLTHGLTAPSERWGRCASALATAPANP